MADKGRRKRCMELLEYITKESSEILGVELQEWNAISCI